MADVRFGNAANAYGAINKMVGVGGGEPIEQGASIGKPSFGDLLGESLTKAKDTGYKTESMSVKSLVNQTELADLVTAVTNAELTLKTVVAVRDRAVQAYNDILKMPI